MPRRNSIFYPLALSLAFAAGLFVAPAAAAPAARFSQSLEPAKSTECGVAKLDSDQAAVLDALVRRDAGRFVSTTSDQPAAIFSERLTADERRLAGLTLLSADELTKLNAFVAQYQSGTLARALLAPPTVATLRRRAEATENKDARGRIRGSFSLSYGWGSGDYSEKTGSMMLYYDDPAGRYSVSIGYSESHVKGPMIYRDPYHLPYSPHAPLAPVTTRP